MALVWASIGTLERGDLLRTLLKFSTVAICIGTGISLYLGIDVAESVVHPVGEDFSSRLTAGLRHPNILGQFAGFLLLVAVACTHFRLLPRSAGVLVSCLLAAALWFSGSRGAVLGSAAGLLVVWGASQRRPAGFICLTAAVGLTVLLGLWISPVQTQIPMLDRYSLDTLQQAPEETGRNAYWSGSFQVFRNHPWLGVGTFNLPAAIARSDNPSTTAVFLSEEFPTHAHNLYLQYSATAGVIGLGLLFLIGFTMVSDSLHLLKSGLSEKRLWGVIGLGSATLVAIAGCIDVVIGFAWVSNLVFFCLYGAVRGEAHE